MPITNLFRGEEATAAGAACLKQLTISYKARHFCRDLHCVVCLCNTLVTANQGPNLLASSLSILEPSDLQKT